MYENYTQEKVKEISENIAKEIDTQVLQGLSIENLLKLKEQIDWEITRRENIVWEISILDQMMLDDKKKLLERERKRLKIKHILDNLEYEKDKEEDIDDEELDFNEYDDCRYCGYAIQEEHDERLQEEYLKDSYKVEIEVKPIDIDEVIVMISEEKEEL